MDFYGDGGGPWAGSIPAWRRSAGCTWPCAWASIPVQACPVSGCLAPASHSLAADVASGACAGTASPQSPRSAARDIETPTRRLRTIEGNICAGKVILIIVIQHGGDRERAGSRLRGGPYHRDQEILGRARPRERPPLLFWASGNVLCQVPVSCLFVWERFNTSDPRPARLSWSVPVQVPVKGRGHYHWNSPQDSLPGPMPTTAIVSAAWNALS